MNSFIKYLSLVLLSATLFVSCKNHKKVPSEKQTKEIEEQLVGVNRYLIKKDAEAIESYVKRREWDMKVTDTGLYYEIYKQGEGRKAETGKIATIDYTVMLLDGTLCYTSDSLGSKSFRIGMGGVEHGLEQGILLLREGDKARFIMPPYLAHGIVGDGKKIPGRAILIYNVELLRVDEN